MKRIVAAGGRINGREFSIYDPETNTWWRRDLALEILAKATKANFGGLTVRDLDRAAAMSGGSWRLVSELVGAGSQEREASLPAATRATQTGRQGPGDLDPARGVTAGLIISTGIWLAIFALLWLMLPAG